MTFLPPFLSLSLSLSLFLSLQTYGFTYVHGAFRETKLRDRANRGSVEHSGLRSPWELPRIASREPRISSSIYLLRYVLFEMFKWLDKREREARTRRDVRTN